MSTIDAKLTGQVELSGEPISQEQVDLKGLSLDRPIDYTECRKYMTEIASSKPGHDLSTISKLTLRFPADSITYTDQDGNTHSVTSVPVYDECDTLRKALGRFLFTKYAKSVKFDTHYVGEWSQELQKVYDHERAAKVQVPREVIVSTSGQSSNGQNSGASTSRQGTGEKRSSRKRSKVYIHNNS